MKFDTFILENNLGTIKDTVDFTVKMITTNHAEERKNRDESKPITNEQIIQTIKDGIGTIASNVINGIDTIGKKYWIYNESLDHLNVIGTLVRQQNSLVFLVITIIHKKDFHTNVETKKIEI